MATSSSPITQVSQTTVPSHHALQPQLLTRLHLDLRGSRFNVDRDTIMNLPESVLLCLFPNGLVLSRQGGGGGGGEGESDDEEEVYIVDVSNFSPSILVPSKTKALAQFDPLCFTYVLTFFRDASDRFYGTTEHPGIYHAQQSLLDPSAQPPSEFASSQNPLLTKQAIIVLREELEFFVIPPTLEGKPATDGNGSATQAMSKLKRDCADVLLDKQSIFTALQRNVNKENNIAEQHLIDMLCMRCEF
jgi:hypothetical protein